MIAFAVIIVAFPAARTTAQEASVSPAAQYYEGMQISVDWSGPDALGDFLAIAAPGTAAADFLRYARTSAGNPASFEDLPAGDYELRYVSANGLNILISVAFRIVAPGADDGIAALMAPSEAIAGSEITVTVSDPGDPADYVTVVEATLPDTAFGPLARFRGANEVQLVLPENPGDYQIRQVRAHGLTVLYRQDLDILPNPKADAAVDEAPAARQTETAAATPATEAKPPQAAAAAPARTIELTALVAVDPASEFGVAFSDAPPAGAELFLSAEGGALSGSSWPVGTSTMIRITAPSESGDYDLILMDAQSGAEISRRALEVR